MKNRLLSAPASSITKREQEVLELLGVGMTNKEIAAHLELAARTVETHVERVLGKLGVSSRTRAVIEARRIGLLSAAQNAAASSLPAPPNNLPLPSTQLIGRSQDISEVSSLLGAYRLVTLTGSGGVGKTRLGLGAAADLLDRFPQGIWFTDLSVSSGPESVARAIARAVGVQERPNQPLSGAIVRALKRRRALLLFDNCEHVAEAAAEIADEILHGCQDVRILVTSRAPLGIIGENVYRVGSLAFPTESAAVTADAALRFGAVELFVDRARALQNGFTLTDDNAWAVGAICRCLDGIPLAIELAAARTNALSIDSLAENLAKHFHLLRAAGGHALPRHQTMRALIDWSYDHLSEGEQTLFRRLAIFAGSFNLELTSAACPDASISEIEVLDLLASLIDKSLVQPTFGDASRYRLLETTRQYAREKLDASGEYDALARAHCTAMVELAERLDAAAETAPNQIWYALAQPEVENWWAALEWALNQRGALELGQRLAGSLDGVWQWYSDVEGWRWIRMALEAAGERTPPAVRARLELANAKMAGNTGIAHYAESIASAERALPYYSQANDPIRLLRTRHNIGRALVYMRRLAKGEAILQDTLRIAREMGALKSAGAMMETLGLARLFQGDTSGACDLWTDGLALLRRAGSRDEECAAFTIHLGEARFEDGKFEEALRLALRAADVYRTTNYRTGLWYALLNVAACLIAIGRFEDARVNAREALALTRELGSELGTAVALQHLAAVAALRKDDPRPTERENPMRAARLLGFVDGYFAAIELVRENTEQHEYDAATAALRDQLGAAGLTKLLAEGRTWSEDLAVAEAHLV